MATGAQAPLQTFAYAARLDGAMRTCEVHLPNDPHAHFSYLSLNVEELFLTGKSAWLVERTLLTTGVLAALLDARDQGPVWLTTPHLAVAYLLGPCPLAANRAAPGWCGPSAIANNVKEARLLPKAGLFDLL